ncbi:MAG: MFS transporter [Desulfatibacillaceae bacterium]
MDKPYRRVINSWCMYDFANSAFATTIMAAMFPPFYRRLVLESGAPANAATAYWGYTAAVALLIVAVVAPVLGAIADHTGGKKKYTGFFCGLGVLCTAGFVLLDTSWTWASILFIGGNLGFAGGNIFYESLLPHIAKKNDIDQISTRGFALGYVGGGILLIINVAWVMRPHWFGMPGVGFALKASFLSVAVWWGLFAIPFFRNVPEPPRFGTPGKNPVRQGFVRLGRTFRELSRYRQLLLFLVAYWIYNDGIGTIIKMATAYGDEIGIGVPHMTAALVITQFVGIPFTFLFGAMAGRIGAKRCILIALGVYTGISCAGFYMTSALHFYILAFVVGTVQGGSQGLSRSLFGAMVPPHKSSEFFGFYSTSAKMAGIAGPLLFAVVSQATGTSRLSIVSLIVFFIVGGVLLCFVDVDEGVAVCRKSALEAGVPVSEVEDSCGP